MGMFKTARLESAVVDMRPVASGIVLRVLATRGRRWPAASAWQFEKDEADMCLGRKRYRPADPGHPRP